LANPEAVRRGGEAVARVRARGELARVTVPAGYRGTLFRSTSRGWRNDAREGFLNLNTLKKGSH
jgi:hypothetical protein